MKFFWSNWLGMLLCLLPLSASAQALLQLPAPNSPETQVFSYPSEQGLTLLFWEGNSAEIFLINDLWEVQSQVSLSELPSPDAYDFLGATDQAEALHLCYQEQTTGQYEVISVDKTEGETNWYAIDMGRLARRNVFWGTFTYEGVLHVLRMPRGSSTIRLCRFEGGKNFETLEFEVETQRFLDRADYQFLPMIEDSSQSLAQSWQLAKLYQYGNQMYLSLDISGETQVVALDLNRGEKQEYQFEAPLFPSDRDGRFAHKSNSYIADNYLYQFAAYQDSISLRCYSLEDGQLIAETSMGKHSESALGSGEFWEQQAKGEALIQIQAQEWLERLSEMPYVALNGELREEGYVALRMGGVFPSQDVGLTGMVLDEEVHQVYYDAVFPPGSLKEIAESEASLAAFRFPPPRLRNKPMLHAFFWKGDKFAGYWETDSDTYIISY